MQPEKLSDIYEDLETLDISSPGSLGGVSGMIRMLMATRGIDDRARAKVLSEMPTMRSEIGHRISEFAMSDAFQPFSYGNKCGCCAQAENYFTKSITTDQQKRHTRSFKSLIITKDSAPVGIVKNHGEYSCYGLETIEEFGLIKGVFSEPSNELYDNYAALKPRRSHPQLAIEDTGGFNPIRFSAFAVPLATRQTFMTPYRDEKTYLETSHEQLQEAVATMRRSAPGSRRLAFL